MKTFPIEVEQNLVVHNNFRNSTFWFALKELAFKLPEKISDHPFNKDKNVLKVS